MNRAVIFLLMILALGSWPGAAWAQNQYVQDCALPELVRDAAVLLVGRSGQGLRIATPRQGFPNVGPNEPLMPMTPIIALVPLDERPVNTRYPQMLGAIGGAQVALPPPEISGRQRKPADLPAVRRWLEDAAQTASAALVSADFLGYGNLISARISADSAADALARLHVLAGINHQCPVHAFSLITRVPHANDCVEEPGYWCVWGMRLAQYARLTHQAERENLSSEDRARLSTLETEIPADAKADWLTRRLRNHVVNLALLDMAARRQITSLLITSDDTAPHGFSSRERDWLRGWPRLIGPALSERVMMHPGADEVGSTLVARVICGAAGRAPRVWTEWAVPGDESSVAPYEDRPVRETVRGQIAACGCVPTDSPAHCDFVLGVVTPAPGRGDYRPEFLQEDRPERAPGYTAFLQRLAGFQQQGIPVALADVAYPNGADPLLMEMLLSPECPLRAALLCAFGAWNTAGNTLGVVVAQAACALFVGSDPARAAAQSLFLAHRFLEDWAYQTVIRRLARADAERQWGRRDPDPETFHEQAHVCEFIAQELGARLTVLQSHGIGAGLEIAPGSVALPWRRTFEVDFSLTAAQMPGIMAP